MHNQQHSIITIYYIVTSRGDIIKSLFKSVATLTIFSIITKFLGFLFRLYLSRILSTSILGMYTVASSVALVMETIIVAGMPLVISRTTAANTKNLHKTYSSVSVGLIWCTTLAIVLTTLVVFGKSVFEHIFTNSATYIILLSMTPTLLFSAIYTPFKGYLWGEERYFAVSVIELIEQIIRIIASIILFTCVKGIDVILPAGLGLSIAAALSCLIGVIVYFCVGGKLLSPAGQYKNVITSVMPLTATRVAGSLLPTIINVILPLSLVAIGYTSTQSMSVIGVSVGMTLPLLYVPSAVTMSLGMALIPKMSALNTNKNSSYALSNQISTALNFTIYSCILFIPLFIGLGVPICLLLYNNAQAGVYLSKYAFLIMTMGVSQISTSILNALGHEKASFANFTIASVIMLILIAVLPAIVGIDALFVAMCANSSVTYLLNIRKINKVTSHCGNYIKKMSLMLIVSLPVALLCKLIHNLLLFVFPNIVCMALSCAISMITLVVLLMCFNLIDYQSINYITQKIKLKRIKN